ncbi:hypothetical protein FK178_09615 [Antarcticibacterium arcticum]|uniref:Uncharacterized protein n=1 Tax=Antarcticibacterium arcticum TaxID=2585771 RepID=A0A5B8YNW4_9FLAO|nr:hypothetical protein [Antarcticibacterium arcticum]QED37966.1 hypothetical protein FK178_09615 [Antarcticibacterium arcticum]
MKRVILITALMFTSALTLISCREPAEKETVIREVEVERTQPVEVKVEEREGVFERSAKKVDEKINREIDEKIDEIDDN